MKRMHEAYRYAICWVIACSLSHLVRLVIVYTLTVWTADGKLRSQPLFDLVVFVHMAMIGVIFCLLSIHRVGPEEGDV